MFAKFLIYHHKLIVFCIVALHEPATFLYSTIEAKRVPHDTVHIC